MTPPQSPGGTNNPPCPACGTRLTDVYLGGHPTAAPPKRAPDYRSCANCGWQLEPEYTAPLSDEQVVTREADLAFRLAIQSADQRYQADGAGGTKTWFRDYLVPELGKRGLRIVASLPTPPEPQ